MSKLEQFKKFENDGQRFEANRLLFKWLSDDDERAALYRELLDRGRCALKFQSRADTAVKICDQSEFAQDVYLLTARADIGRALTDSAEFSNFPYQALGSGTFMLGLDDGDHIPQRKFASAFLKTEAEHVAALATIAFKAAAVQLLKQRKFDLAELAEQAALRFVCFLFGLAQGDHYLLQESMRAAYLALNYQILGRHFVTDMEAMPGAKIAMAKLLKTVANLIDLYRVRVGQEQQEEFELLERELKELRDYKDEHEQEPLKKFDPILRRIAAGDPNAPKHKYSGTDLAVIIVGLIAGTIGNVQASVAIAVNAFFDPRHKIPKPSTYAAERSLLEFARDAAKRSCAANPDADVTPDPVLSALIWEALRLNPPVAFLPRKTTRNVSLPSGGKLPADSVVILAIGAALRDGTADLDKFNYKPGDPVTEHPLIFGGPPDSYLHQCIGQHLAMPLISYIVKCVLALPGLAESLDPLTALPQRLRKRWGFNCQSYPLEYDRFKLLKHSSLNVVMRVKTPVAVHAEALKLVIKYGAPRIEKKLRDAKHVHFAWFEFLENDTKLALHTVYDRDFDTYIEHFALEIGPLFDKLFEHIEDAPPMPVHKYPKEFIDTVRRFDRRPVGGYLFSAYPEIEAGQILNHFSRKYS